MPRLGLGTLVDLVKCFVGTIECDYTLYKDANGGTYQEPFIDDGFGNFVPKTGTITNGVAVIIGSRTGNTFTPNGALDPLWALDSDHPCPDNDLWIGNDDLAVPGNDDRWFPFT